MPNVVKGVRKHQKLRRARERGFLPTAGSFDPLSLSRDALKPAPRRPLLHRVASPPQEPGHDLSLLVVGDGPIPTGDAFPWP